MKKKELKKRIKELEQQIQKLEEENNYYRHPVIIPYSEPKDYPKPYTIPWEPGTTQPQWPHDYIVIYGC